RDAEGAERPERERQPLPHLADERARGEPTRREHDAPQRMIARETNRRELDARRVGRDEERRNAFFSLFRCGVREDDEMMRDADVRDERLVAVEDPRVAV